MTAPRKPDNSQTELWGVTAAEAAERLGLVVVGRSTTGAPVHVKRISRGDTRTDEQRELITAIRQNSDIPVLIADEVMGRQHPLLIVWCPSCGHEHTHGSPEGHRVEHCPPGGLFDPTGYYLVTRATASRIGHRAKRRARGMT